MKLFSNSRPQNTGNIVKVTKKEKEQVTYLTKKIINYFEMLRLFCEGHFERL
jgi:uncharacterized protein (UPF0297 family)